MLSKISGCANRESQSRHRAPSFWSFESASVSVEERVRFEDRFNAVNVISCVALSVTRYHELACTMSKPACKVGSLEYPNCDMKSYDAMKIQVSTKFRCGTSRNIFPITELEIHINMTRIMYEFWLFGNYFFLFGHIDSDILWMSCSQQHWTDSSSSITTREA